MGEAIPVPAQACLRIYAKGRAILGAPALRTGVGSMYSMSLIAFKNIFRSGGTQNHVQMYFKF